MEQTHLKKCNQEDCKVSEDGKCLEGLPLDTCPHFYFDTELSNETEEEQLNLAEEEELNVKLYTGKAMAIEEIGLVTNEYNCQKIFILGESESGKTTLIATIFDLFQKSSIKELNYGGSLTQIGFEERCHLSRSNSNAIVPTTEKTKSQEFDFLHLVMYSEFTNEKKHLLLSDISGEKLKAASSSSTLMNDLTLLGIADKIIVILDGVKIFNRQEREATLFKAKNLLQRGLDEGLFNNKTDIQIVVSKWDVFINEQFDFDKIIKEPFIKKFENRLGKLHFSRIAARPERNLETMHVGFGIYELLVDWMTENQLQKKDRSVNILLPSERWFNNFNLQ